MPRLSTNLLSTERAVQMAKPTGPRTEYRIAGCRGLVLRVTQQGIKSWHYTYKSPATRQWRKKGLGNYPTISLQLAKEAALDCMAAVRSGTDPLSAPPTPELSFKQLSDDYTKAHKGRHSTKWTKEVERVLATDIMPALNGHSRTAAITRHDVSKVVEKVATRRAYASANLALKIIRALFRWGVSTGRCETDPTFGIKKFPSKARERVLSDAEICVVWNAHSAFRDAFRLQLLLGMRIGEVLLAAKDEINIEQRLWVIPACRTKTKREHTCRCPRWPST